MGGPMQGWRLARTFARDRRAMGAVEFALITPFLLTLYLGGSQLSMALTIDRKVENVGNTVNDLVSQLTTKTDADLAGIFNIASSIMAPYDMGPLGIQVTQVAIDGNGIGRVDWDFAGAGKPKLAKGTIVALPGSFKSLTNRFLVMSRTSYAYAPVAGYFITGTIQMGGTSYLDPRNNSMIECKDC